MSRIEIREDALRFNIAAISKKAPIDKVYAVLKDNAYGHGLVEFGTLCAKNGIQNAVVRNSDEALRLCDIFKNILVLAECADFALKDNISYAINSIEDIDKIPAGANVQLKVDSGMHRSGVLASELDAALKKIVASKLNLVGVFSHLRSADELSTESFWQEKNFLEIKKIVVAFCESNKLKRPLFHLQNSAGLFRSGALGEFDMARVGIALYGYLDMPNAVGSPELRPVMSLWADKIASRSLKAGQAVGYGATGKIYTDTVVSAYDIGYADGFFRVKAEGEYILPNGSRLVGRVSMDNICVESADDSVCVFDDAAKLAKRYNTISYEIITRLNPSIKRVVV